MLETFNRTGLGMTAQEILQLVPPCGLNFIGQYDYRYILKECERVNGNCASTRNAMYCYSDSLGWERIVTASPLVFDVKDSGYISGRGYYVVIDNSEDFQIDTDSVILIRNGSEFIEEPVIGIEKHKHLLDPPVTDSRWSLITRKKVADKTTEEIKVVMCKTIKVIKED